MKVFRELGVGTGQYELVIVGGGVVGSEAAFVCASRGIKTLLVTTNLDSVYALGVGMAQLNPPSGTLMANLLDQTRGTNQADGLLLRVEAKYVLESLNSLHLLQSNVTDLLWTHGRLGGVVTWEGVVRLAPKVALCVGSFLKARLSTGTVIEVAGRLSEMAYDDLYLKLVEYGFVFEETSIEVPNVRGALPHTVTFERFGLEEIGQDGFTLKRTPGLYSAGVCVEGEMTYQGAAIKGRELGINLASAVTDET